MRVNGTCLNPEVIESLINADRLDVKQFRLGLGIFAENIQRQKEGHKNHKLLYTYFISQKNTNNLYN